MQDLATLNASEILRLAPLYSGALDCTDNDVSTGATQDWLELFAAKIGNDTDFRVDGYSSFSVEDLTTRSSGSFCYDSMAASPQSYMLSAALWSVIQTLPDAYSASRIKRLYQAVCNPAETRLSLLLLRGIQTAPDVEVREHMLRTRLEVFRRCMELLLFPKAVINPWLTGKHREAQRYGQHVQYCGIYAPNAAFQSNTLVSVFRKTRSADESLELMGKTSGAAIPQRPLSDSTLYRCLRSLEEVGWIKTVEIWTRSHGTLRFISPQVFCVINKLEEI